MKRITLNQLRAFEQVARLRSISAAAGVCHRTQPAVSMQMKALERECGLPLTEMVGREMHLTEAGDIVARYVRRVQHELEELDQQLAAMRGQHLGTLNVGIVSTAKYFAPHLLASFTKRHRGVALSMQVENRAHVLQLLADNAIDLAIMGVPPESLDAVALAFADHPLGLVLPPKHAALSRKRVRLADLSADTFIVREPGSGTRAVMERYFATEKFTPRKLIQMTGNEAIKQAVMAGLGIGFLSLNTLVLERDLGLLNVPEMHGLPVIRRWHIVHRSGKQLLPIAQAFRDFVCATGASYADVNVATHDRYQAPGDVPHRSRKKAVDSAAEPRRTRTDRRK